MKRLIFKCGLSPGDIVLLTAAVRDLHCCYPGRFLTDVRTSCSELWENNPYLTPLKEGDAGVEILECSYPLIDHSNERPYHCLHGFIEFLNRRLTLNIKPTQFRGDIHLSAQEKAWFSQVREVTGEDTPFWIVAAGGKYDLTIKWWDTRRYQEVVDRFQGRIQFVQVGDCGHHHPGLKRVIDLRGRTSLRELVRLVYHADGVLCSVTALMHLAAAVETKQEKQFPRPCVVVAGGREPAHWEAYPGHQFLHTNGLLECCATGGCWKDRTFPLRDGDHRDAVANRCVSVVNGLPRCMDMIQSAEVVRRIELFYGRKNYLRPAELSAAERGVAATANNPYDGQALNLHSAGLACDEFIRAIPPYPGGFSGRGIVVCGGGIRYFTAAWVCINMLRRLGCRLPIQFWYLGPREMNGEMKALLAGLGVQCVDAYRVRRIHPVRRLGGWELKPYAILRCSFREVLLLDADNVPVVNPEFLFETPQFRRTGAVFWPDYDYRLLAKARTVWRSCGLRPPRECEFETGQVLVDKERSWEALRLTLWFNENSDFYHRHVHGDKETFHLAFRKLKQAYSLVKTPIQSLEGTMCQHDFEGRRIFQHRNSDKWDLFLRNRHVEDFRYDQECRKFIRELQRVWSGRIGPTGLERRIRPTPVRRLRAPKFHAVMISSSQRDSLRNQTLDNLARTDWGEAPVHLQIAEPAAEDTKPWQVGSALAALKAGLHHGADYVLFLEDDLAFNRHLRYNLLNWVPLKAGALVVASLYNPSVRESACVLPANARVMDPNSVFGSQAFVLARPAVQFIVGHWNRVSGAHDFRISRLGGRIGKRFYYHAPSLVDRVDPVKDLGGVYDRAMDFDAEWRAKSA